MQSDVIVIGSGIGGLVTAIALAAKGAKVLVLERYLIPGGSAGDFERQGYRFDVGASMIFGFGQNGTTNLLSRALEAVNVSLEVIPDSVQIHYHLPNGLDLKVDRVYDKFLQNLTAYFPNQSQGIRRFYDEAQKVFHCLNSIDLLSLEEPRYLMRVFFQHPLACLGLVKYLPQNAADVARRYENRRSVGIQLANGQIYRAKRIVSNATRWDTFEKLLSQQAIPINEKKWQQRYQKSPSFLSLHMGVKAEVLPEGTECHHIILEDWERMADPEGTL